MLKKVFSYIVPICLTVLFIIWTVLVKVVDPHFIDGIGYLGFYSMNSRINDFVIEFGRTKTFDILTDIGLYIALASVAVFAGIGIYQWVKRKSFKKVDPIIFLLLAIYVISVAFYLVFEIVKINYSPLSTPDDLKPSYPSSHIFVFIAFTGVGLIAMFNYVKVSKLVRICSYVIFGALSVVYSLARLFSLNHYFSDVIGAILLASILISLFVCLNRDFNVVEEEVVSE